MEIIKFKGGPQKRSRSWKTSITDVRLKELILLSLIEKKVKR